MLHTPASTVQESVIVADHFLSKNKDLKIYPGWFLLLAHRSRKGKQGFTNEGLDMNANVPIAKKIAELMNNGMGNKAKIQSPFPALNNDMMNIIMYDQVSSGE